MILIPIKDTNEYNLMIGQISAKHAMNEFKTLKTLKTTNLLHIYPLPTLYLYLTPFYPNLGFSHYFDNKLARNKENK